MDIEELLKAEYKARVDYYGKSMDEIIEKLAKETTSYKELKKENEEMKKWGEENSYLKAENRRLEKENRNLRFKLGESQTHRWVDTKDLKNKIEQQKSALKKMEETNRKLKERIDVLYEFIERNDKLVDEVIDKEDLDKLNRYIYIDDDLVDRTLESED